MANKKRCLIQKIILLSIFFNVTCASSDADVQLYNKYKNMLKRFSTRPIPGQEEPKEKIKKFLKHLNIYENLQLKPDKNIANDNVQVPALKPPEGNPLEFPDYRTSTDTLINKNEDLASLYQASQNYAKPAAVLNLNQDNASPGQNHAMPSQNYAMPSQDYALPSQSYVFRTPSYAVPSISYGNQASPLNLNPMYASPSQSYGSVPLSKSQNDLIKYLGYMNYISPSLADNQNPFGTYSNYNPSNLMSPVNYNSLNQNDVGNTQNMVNLNPNYMEPPIQFDQNHGPPTLIDLNKIDNPNLPDMHQDIYDSNILNDPDNVPLGILSQNGLISPNIIMSQTSDQDRIMSQLSDQDRMMSQISDQDHIMSQNSNNQPRLSHLANQNDGDSSIYNLFNENPKLYEKLLKNGNFMTGLMNRMVMKITDKAKKDRLKKFRNKVAVKRLVTKGQVMTGPVYDEKYQLLYIPLLKVPGENVGDKVSEPNNQYSYQFDHNSVIEGQNKLRNSDLYDPPHGESVSDTVDVLPPFKGDESPNAPASYTQYMPDYLFTDYWTYEKPLLQDDCPDYAINVAGVCIKYPPYRKFLQ